MGIDKLIFDVTDANTIADSHSVGAYVRSSDGTLIDHATINTVERLAVDATMKDGAGTAITSTGGALDVNIAGGVNVEVDLSHVDDSVRLGDGTAFFTSTTVASDIGLDVNIINTDLLVNDAALADTAIASAAVALTAANVAEDLVASPLAARKYLYAYNNDNRVAYVGATGVSAATGYPVAPGSEKVFRAGPSIDIEFVSAKISHDMRTLELS